MRLSILVGLALSVAASAQDTPAPPKADDARETLAAAIEATMKAGGFTISGKIDRDNPYKEMGIGIGGLTGDELEGKVSGLQGADGTLKLGIEAEEGVVEIYRKGGRSVNRQTWSGHQVSVGGTPDELGSVLDLGALKMIAPKATKLKTLDGAKVGETDCVVVGGEFPLSAISSGEGGGMIVLQQLKKLDVTFHFGREDRLLRKISFTLTKGMSDMIRMGMPGGDDEDDDGDDEGDDDDDAPNPMNPRSIKFKATYTVTLSGHDAKAAVEIPAELGKFLAE